MVLIELYKWWKTNSSIWFGCSSMDDKMIADKWGKYIDVYANVSFNRNDNPLKIVGYIILYDQIVRHVYRAYYSNLNRVVYLNRFNDIVIDWTKHAIHYDIDLLNVIDNSMKPFILMPLRHTFDRTILRLAIHRINVWRQYDKQICQNPTVLRFIKATILSFSQNETIYIRHKIGSVSNRFAITKNNVHKIHDILDDDSPRIQFLIDNFIPDKKNLIMRTHWKFYNKYYENNPTLDSIIVSLSGGVDSMVTLWCTKLWCNKNNIKIIAVHVNYGNRESTVNEVKLLQYWCSMINVSLFVRHIWEIKRVHRSVSDESMSSSERSLYESVTKSIRFMLYKIVDTEKSIVVLGHNLNDCTENIFSNLINGKNQKNLKGMKYISNIDDVNIVRPMIEIHKNEIITFAIDNGIPFLVDSTPGWSNRGMMRDKLIPGIIEFNSNIIPNLHCYIDQMSDIYQLLDKLIVDPYIAKHSNNFRENKIIITDNNMFIWEFEMWKKVIYAFCNVNNIPYPGLKGLRHFYDILQNLKNEFNNKIIILSKDIKLKFMICDNIPILLFI